MRKILFVNNPEPRCGIHQIGKRIHGMLSASKKFEFKYAEFSSAEEFFFWVQGEFDSVIFNWYPSTLPWVLPALTCALRQKEIPSFGIFHDPMDPATIQNVDYLFDAYMIHDQTSTVKSLKKFTTCRPIPRFPAAPLPEKFSIGSHGFGVSPWKAFDLIAEAVNAEFDECDLNFNIGAAAFGDNSGESVRTWERVCQGKITKPGIKLNVTSHFFESESDLIRWLQGNSANVYFHRDQPGVINGPAGSADLAIAAQRPVVVNDSYMYRHLSSNIGSWKNDLAVRCRDTASIKLLYDWATPERVLGDYERMIERVLC